jgi:acetyltransferase-like isoleucine patch superfamily enzyme
VLAGSDIGEGTLLAANSVVSGKLEDHVMYGGTPARRIKNI